MHLVARCGSLQAVLKYLKESQVSSEKIYDSVYFVSEAFQGTSKEGRNICQEKSRKRNHLYLSVWTVCIWFSVSPATQKALNFCVSS